MNSPLTLAVAGAKGGVGKTTTSINVAKALAGEDRRTLIVELDLAMANMVDFLSLPDDPEPTLHDVLAGEAQPLDAVYEIGDNTSVAPSGTSLDGYADTDLDLFPAALDAYRDAFDLVVIDTGAGLNRSVVEPLRRADATIVVSTPRVASVRDAKKTITLSERVDTPVCGLVLTQSGTGASPGPETIAEFLDVDLLGHIPDDDAVPASQDKGEPVVDWAPKSSAGITYRETAQQVLDALDRAPEPQSAPEGEALGSEEPGSDHADAPGETSPRDTTGQPDRTGAGGADESAPAPGNQQDEGGTAVEGGSGLAPEAAAPDDDLAPGTSAGDPEEPERETVEQTSPEEPAQEPVDQAPAEADDARDETGEAVGDGDAGEAEDPAGADDDLAAPTADADAVPEPSPATAGDGDEDPDRGPDARAAPAEDSDGDDPGVAAENDSGEATGDEPSEATGDDPGVTAGDAASGTETDAETGTEPPDGAAGAPAEGGSPEADREPADGEPETTPEPATGPGSDQDDERDAEGENEDGGSLVGRIRSLLG